MNGSDVRKFIKQGEQATELLEKMGYQYSAKPGEHPHWIAPENPLDPIIEGLKKLVAEQVAAATPKPEPVDPAKGPNWHIVKELIGKLFMVRQENIPLTSVMRGFGKWHFQGKRFTALDLQYRRTPDYTGYAVLFKFNTRPYQPEVVWLPLSACAFPN